MDRSRMGGGRKEVVEKERMCSQELSPKGRSRTVEGDPRSHIWFGSPRLDVDPQRQEGDELGTHGTRRP